TIPYMVDAGYSNTFGAFMITLTSIPSLLSKPVWGWLVDRVDAKSAVIGFMTNAVSLVIIVIAVRSHTNWAVYTGFFLLGLGWGWPVAPSAAPSSRDSGDLDGRF